MAVKYRIVQMHKRLSRVLTNDSHWQHPLNASILVCLQLVAKKWDCNTGFPTQSLGILGKTLLERRLRKIQTRETICLKSQLHSSK